MKLVSRLDAILIRLLGFGAIRFVTAPCFVYFYLDICRNRSGGVGHGWNRLGLALD